MPTTVDPGPSAAAVPRALRMQRRIVWLLTALAVALLLGAVGALQWRERQLLLDEASSLSQRRAARLADELTQSLAVAKVAIAQTEARLRNLPAGAALAKAMGEGASDRAALLKALPLPFELHALQASGRVVDLVSGMPREGVGGHTHARPTPDAAAAGWVVDLSQGATGSRTIPVQRAAAPNAHGVAAYSVDFDHGALLSRLETSRAPQGGSAALFRIDADGSTTVLARAPHDDAELGRRVQGPLAQALARAPGGVFMARTQLDSAHRTIAYRRLAADAGALVVAYGMATDAVLAPWSTRLPAVTVVSLLLAAGLLWSGWRLDRSVQTLAQGRQALRQSESHFRTLADNLPDIVVRVDEQGRQLWANAAVERATGRPTSAFIGKSIGELGLPAEHAAQFTAALQRLFQHGRTERLEFALPGPDGLRQCEALLAHEPRIPGAAPTALVISRDITDRVQGLESLRESEARHRQLFDVHPNPMWVYDLQTLAFLEVNAAALARYGYSHEEFLGMTIKDIRPQEEVPRMLESVTRKVQGIQDAGLWRHRLRGGELIDVQITSHALLFKGRPAKLVLAQDVTRQHRAEVALRESEERLRLALQAANQGLYDLDLRSGQAVVSAEYARMLGYAPEEFQETNAAWRERLHPDDQARVVQAFEDYCAGRLPEYRIEFRQRTKDGQWKWILSLGKVQERSADGQPLRMLGTHTDITAARQAQAALHASEARLAYLLSSTATVIYTASTRNDYDAIYYSPNLPALLGWQPEQFVQDPGFWLHHVHADDRGAVLAQMDSLPQQGEVVLEYRFRHADGSWRWMRDALRQVRDGAGNATELVGSWIDITAHREAENEVRRLAVDLEQRVHERTAQLQQAMLRAESASRAKSNFLSHMSHELRTPMNAILGFAQVIEMSDPTPRQREWAGQIHRAGNHLLQMIEDLLDLARIETGRVAIRIEPLLLAPLLAEALALVQPLIEARKLRLVQQCPDIAWTVNADRLRLRQVLVNLLSNAAKYNRDGGTVTVRCERRGERLRLAVADTGNGIAPEQLARLFRPFERLGAEMGQIEGTGIGLALSSQLADLMDATLGVESQLGVGSVFWIDLPSAQADAPPASERMPLSPPAGRVDFDLLYVEDNASNVELIAAFLAQHGHLRLRTAGDGAAGLALASTLRPDCILLDIHLPGMDGYQILQRLRADPELCSVPVVALSADAMPYDVQRGLAAGFDHYLTKPVDLNELLRVLQRLMPHVGPG